MNLLLAGRRFGSIVFILAMLGYSPCAMAHKTSYGYLKADFAGDAYRASLSLRFATLTSSFLILPSAPPLMATASPIWPSCIDMNSRLTVSFSTKSHWGRLARHAASSPARLRSISVAASTS